MRYTNPKRVITSATRVRTPVRKVTSSNRKYVGFNRTSKKG